VKPKSGKINLENMTNIECYVMRLNCKVTKSIQLSSKLQKQKIIMKIKTKQNSQ